MTDEGVSFRMQPGGQISPAVDINQDLVIEKSIEEAAGTASYGDLPWSLDKAYNMPFSGLLHDATRLDHFATGREGSIRVLKLHGSLNWAYKVRSNEDPANAIRKPGKRNLYCLANTDVLSDMRYRERPGGRSKPMVPLAVPPIYEKASWSKEALGHLWVEAASVFEHAENLIIFGYSFPPTDFAARSLLQGAFHRNQVLQAV